MGKATNSIDNKKLTPKQGQSKPGRPKRKFASAQVKKMSELALAGCQNNTIATIMDIPIDTLTRHFAKLLTKNRADRKLTLRKQQNTSSKDGNVTMQIWLGKQVLGQKDKQDITSGDKPIAPQIIVFGTPIKTNDDTD